MGLFDRIKSPGPWGKAFGAGCWLQRALRDALGLQGDRSAPINFLLSSEYFILLKIRPCGEAAEISASSQGGKKELTGLEERNSSVRGRRRKKGDHFLVTAIFCSEKLIATGCGSTAITKRSWLRGDFAGEEEKFSQAFPNRGTG